MTSKRILVLVAAALIAIVVVVVTSAPVEQFLASAERAPQSHESVLDAAVPPALDERRPLGDFVVEPPPARDLIESQRERAVGAFSVVLRGAVTCPRGPAALTELSFTTTRVNSPVASAAVAADGSFELDVTTLLFNSFEREDPALIGVLPEIVVDARHPHALPAHLLVATHTLHDIELGQRRQLTVAIYLDREACRVAVRVFTELGASSMAQVSAFGLFGADLGVNVATASVSDEGRFEFEIPGGEHVVAIYTTGWRPSTVRVNCRDLGRVDLPPIVLERGAVISGRAVRAEKPLGGSVVQARMIGVTGHAEVSHHPLTWTGATFEWKSQSAFASSEGDFEITGLAFADYALACSGLSGVHQASLHAAEVSAPASGVVVEPVLCPLSLEVLIRGERKTVSFSLHQTRPSASSISSHSTDREGRALLWLEPGASSAVCFDSSVVPDIDYRTRKFELPNCADGEDLTLRIDL